MAFGACVFFATTNAISGSRMPTKTISPSLISRAAATTMSSLSVYCIFFFNPERSEGTLYPRHSSGTSNHKQWRQMLREPPRSFKLKGFPHFVRNRNKALLHRVQRALPHFADGEQR